MSDSNEIENTIRTLLGERGLMVLSTIMKEAPHQGLVAAAAADDLKTIVFTTPNYTRKYENIQKNPGVSLLADNRTNTEKDFMDCTALTIRGKAFIADEEYEKQYHDLYLERHPYMEEFLEAPSSALIVVRVSLYTLVSSFQRVREWSP